MYSAFVSIALYRFRWSTGSTVLAKGAVDTFDLGRTIAVEISPTCQPPVYGREISSAVPRIDGVTTVHCPYGSKIRDDSTDCTSSSVRDPRVTVQLAVVPPTHKSWKE
jgi:hypothetical protein